MAYQKNPTWQNSPSTATPITAQALNRMEDGIEAAAETADEANSRVIGISDVTGLQSELNDKLESPIGIGDVTGLQSELNDKLEGPLGIGDVTGLQSELNGKLEGPLGIGDITGLQSGLDSKLESPIGIGDVTGLQSGLDGKASTTALGQKADESDLTAHTGNAAIHVPSGGSTGQVLKRTASATEWQTEVDTTYETGTSAQLEAGTDTTGRLWSAKDIADYVAAKIAESLPE